MAVVGEAAAFYLERSHPIGAGTGDLNHSFGGFVSGVILRLLSPSNGVYATEIPAIRRIHQGADN
jgi:hypothetical protein